ncbi:UDP-xylose and UDP-N-acetylglucosamine transporter isoform X3 [Salmo trutta]|uniref:UDP-xylose and UDP-N-acetylglucosamine transporter isoform X3 n=1 Tax=Salmo trutta TaxID=8032 RepID=UPI00112FF508|nr:UDP-xylose and UDP-N-acetylglucosamine transporter-like isoform X3 [Salmo trutta]
MWQHCDLCSICLHCIGGVHLRDELWKKETSHPYEQLCNHGDHVLHSQCDQQLCSQLQHRYAFAHDLQISSFPCRYSMSKYLSVAMVSLGIFICTIMSAKQVNVGTKGSDDQGVYAFLHWLIGIAMLTFALLMSARMGIFQETLYKQYGKHSKEALFYNHCLPLPGFLLLSSDIYNHCVLFSQSTPVEVPVIGQAVPVLWLYLLLNVITQYVCIRSVFILTTECASLTVTLVVTLRKFLSLIISILFFKNPFTAWHWVGTGVVFLGTLIYTEVWTSICTALRGSEKLKKKKT